MNFPRRHFIANPTLARVLPFAIFVGLTIFQGQLGEASRYWIYFAKTIVGGWLVWQMRGVVGEMRWAFSWEAVAAGVAVFAFWVALDPFYPKLGKAANLWNPHLQFGAGSALAWLFIGLRIFGSALIVPPLEEVFYRSFFYRNLVKADWQSVPLNHFSWMPQLVTAGLFGLVHPQQWLAGILCGLTYQFLVLRKNRLGDAMTAHAITNALLGIWVAWRGAWQFW